MAVVIVPFTADSDYYSFTTTLDRQQFQFDLYWNSRDNGWYFTLSDVNGNAILSNRMILDMDMTLFCPLATGLPGGALIGFDTSNADQEAGRGDLGTRVLISYAEINSLPPGTYTQL